MDKLDLGISKLTDITVTLKSQGNNNQTSTTTPTTPTTINPINQFLSADTTPTNLSSTNLNNLSKYAQLLIIIEEMGREIRPTYSGSRSSSERLKRGIVHARILVRECLLETERSARN